MASAASRRKRAEGEEQKEGGAGEKEKQWERPEGGQLRAESWQHYRHLFCANAKAFPQTHPTRATLAMEYVPVREEATASRVTNRRTAYSWPPLTAGFRAEGGNTCSNQHQACSPHTYIVDQVDAPPPRRGHWFYYPRSSVLWIWICSKYWEIKRKEKNKTKTKKRRSMSLLS